MSDLTEITSTQSVKIIGSDLSGNETNPVTADGTGALYVSASMKDGNAVPLTSTAEGSKRGLDVSNLAISQGYYSAAVNIRQSATTGAGACVWTMRNPAASTKTVYIERIYLMLGFDLGTPITRSLLRYDLKRFTAATPTGGTAIVVAQQDSADSATVVTDLRFLDTGLTVTGITFGPAFATIVCPASDGATAQYTREGIGFKLLAGEGFAVTLNVAAVVGQSIAGCVVWSER